MSNLDFSYACDNILDVLYCHISRAHQTRWSGRLFHLGFNEVAQFLSKSEVLVSLFKSVFFSPIIILFLRWLKGKVRENLGDFRKSIKNLKFLSPLLHVPYLSQKRWSLTKTSLFDRNWATSLKPSRRSRPLRLVWWALILAAEP
jgi:hypothetical protein